MLTGQHLLHGLARDSHLPGNVGLRVAVLDQALDYAATLGCELLRQARVLQCLGPDLVEATERLLMLGRDIVSCHANGVSTPRCRVTPGCQAIQPLIARVGRPSNLSTLGQRHAGGSAVGVASLARQLISIPSSTGKAMLMYPLVGSRT